MSSSMTSSTAALGIHGDKPTSRADQCAAWMHTIDGITCRNLQKRSISCFHDARVVDDQPSRASKILRKSAAVSCSPRARTNSSDGRHSSLMTEFYRKHQASDISTTCSTNKRMTRRSHGAVQPCPQAAQMKLKSARCQPI